MNSSSVLFVITAVLYSAACVLYLWNLAEGKSQTGRFAFGAATIALTAHTAGIALLGIALRRAPFANLFESLIFLAWALVLIYLLIARRFRVAALGPFVMSLSVCVIVVASILPRNPSPSLLSELNSRWSIVHVTSCLIGYASFTLAFTAAVSYMIHERMLKAKRVNVSHIHLPALSALDSLAYKLVSIGFPMLTLGIVTGAFWAQSAWSSYWHWDPKETWSFITWLIYATYLHVRIIQGRQGKWSNRLLVIGFIGVLVTFLGVNSLGYGLHRYNW